MQTKVKKIRFNKISSLIVTLIFAVTSSTQAGSVLPPHKSHLRPTATANTSIGNEVDSAIKSSSAGDITMSGKQLTPEGHDEVILEEYKADIFSKLGILPSFTIDVGKQSREEPKPLVREVKVIRPSVLDSIKSKPGLKSLHLQYVSEEDESPYITLNLADPKTTKIINNKDSIIYRAVKELKPVRVSVHLGFSAEEIGNRGEDNHNIAISPVLDSEPLKDKVIRILKTLQDNLYTAGFEGRVLIENLDYHNEGEQGAYEHVWRPEFIREVQKETGCGLLVDLGHTLITAQNEKYGAKDGGKIQPLAYLKQIVDENNIADVEEVHISVPLFSHKERRWLDMHQSFFESKNDFEHRTVRELLAYIIDLRAQKKIVKPLVINFETNDDFHKEEVSALAKFLQELARLTAMQTDTGKSSSAGTLNLEDIESLNVEALDTAIASAEGVLYDVYVQSKVAAEVSKLGELGTIVINDDSIPPSQREVVSALYKQDSPALKELERLTGCVIRLRSQLKPDDIKGELIIISDTKLSGYDNARYLMINDIPKRTDGYLPIAPLVGIAKALLGIKDRTQINSSLKELYRSLCKKPLTDEAIQQYIQKGIFNLELPKPEAYDYQKLEMLQRQALAALIAA